MGKDTIEKTIQVIKAIKRFSSFLYYDHSFLSCFKGMIFDQNHSLQLPVGWMSIKNEWFIGIPSVRYRKGISTTKV